jgi:hypothetical protein
MAIDVSIEVDLRDDELVVVKTALSPQAELRLERERDRLAAARHPGVVELLDGHDDSAATMTMAWAGGRSLETVRPALADAIVLLASVCTTVADLHEMGMAHGRLDATHVVVERRRARLCGFAGQDPGEPEPTPSDDVAALGTLVALLAGPHTEAEPIPDHRFGRRRWDGYVRGMLQTLADQATDPDPDHRPTARALARSLAELEPERPLAKPPKHRTRASGPRREARGRSSHDRSETRHQTQRETRDAGTTDRSELRPERGREGRVPLAIVVASATVLAVIGLLGATNRSSGPATGHKPAVRVAPAVAGRASHRSTTTRPATSTTTPKAHRHKADCPHIAGSTADVNGDGCPDAVTIHGAAITIPAGRYQLGQPGDHVAVGDWDCDGTATPALVRPATGEVFVFTAWADPHHSVSVTPAATIADAREPLSRSSGCGPVRVRRADGSVTSVKAKGQ